MHAKAGEILYRMGDRSDAMFIIVSGKIGLFSDAGVEPTELTRLGAGQILGDLSFFTGSLRTAFARAITDVEYHRVPYETIQKQFEAVPPWVQLMTKTLAIQVQKYADEIQLLKDVEEGVPLSKLVVARAWAALTFIPQQFGTRKGNSIKIDWATLRTHANISFREISSSVLRVAYILQSLDWVAVSTDNNGVTEIEIKDPSLLVGFLTYYTRAITKNSAALKKIIPIEFETLRMLASAKIDVTPIHRGQVEIDLVKFKNFTDSVGCSEVTAVSIELLVAHGIEIMKIPTETGVKLRYHQEEVTNLYKYWQVLVKIQQINLTNPSPKKQA